MRSIDSKLLFLTILCLNLESIKNTSVEVNTIIRKWSIETELLKPFSISSRSKSTFKSDLKLIVFVQKHDLNSVSFQLISITRFYCYLNLQSWKNDVCIWGSHIKYFFLLFIASSFQKVSSFTLYVISFK